MEAPIIIEGERIKGARRPSRCGKVEQYGIYQYILSLGTNHAVIKVVHQLTGETLLESPKPTLINSTLPNSFSLISLI